MASAEATPKWLHYAKRCIVQEDYEKASRPPGSPPSSSESQPDENGYDGDTKWWLHSLPKDNVSSLWDPSWEIFLTSVEREEHFKVQEVDAVVDDTLEKKPMDLSEKPEKLLSEMESEWIRVKKNEPWWRTADLNDLASFVTLKSLEHFENCDLPRPHNDIGLEEAQKETSRFTNCLPRSPSGRTGCSPYGLGMPFSTLASDEAENPLMPSSELSKAQLLEALCHSQTRAREAEKAAQEAYNEKEHVITLFLRQASQLFVYKQWLRILQSQPLDTRFIPAKAKNQKRVGRKEPKEPLGKSFGGLVLGLTLVGAGMLLGWTMGWLFPAH